MTGGLAHAVPERPLLKPWYRHASFERRTVLEYGDAAVILEGAAANRLLPELLPLLDGTPACGPGGYTSQSIRDLWRQRVRERLPWGQTGGGGGDTRCPATVTVSPSHVTVT